MTSKPTITASVLKATLFQPISAAAGVSIAGLALFAFALLLPVHPSLYQYAAALVTLGALLQRRDADLWPFTYRPVKRTVDRIVAVASPVLKLLFLTVKLLVWCCILFAGLFLAVSLVVAHVGSLMRL
jgi:hypothetical protein